MRDGLEQAAINGQFISEYNNGLVVFKPDSVWKVKRNRITGLHYQSARAGLRIVGKRIGFANNNVQIIKLEECFNERVPTEKQAYMNFLGRESKGVTDITHRLGYQHGRPLNISP